MRLSEFRAGAQRIILAASVAGILTACGGSGSTAQTSNTGGTPGSTPPPAAVTGIATPHSVSVVTAN